MQKYITSIYGRFNTYLLYMLILVLLFLTVLAFFFPGYFPACPTFSSPPWYRRSDYVGTIITILVVCLAISSIMYLLIGIGGYIFSLISKDKIRQTKKKQFLQLIIKGLVGIVSTCIIFFVLSLVLALFGVSSCPLTLP